MLCRLFKRRWEARAQPNRADSGVHAGTIRLPCSQCPSLASASQRPSSFCRPSEQLARAWAGQAQAGRVYGMCGRRWYNELTPTINRSPFSEVEVSLRQQAQPYSSSRSVGLPGPNPRWSARAEAARSLADHTLHPPDAALKHRPKLIQTLPARFLWRHTWLGYQGYWSAELVLSARREARSDAVCPVLTCVHADGVHHACCAGVWDHLVSHQCGYGCCRHDGPHRQCHQKLL